MVEGGMEVLCTWTALLALASAGPLTRVAREVDDYQNMDLSAYVNFTANEVCFSDNEVYQKGDLMPNPGPCEECRCEPPSIVCNMVKCAVNNNGCRTIQRPNHCCPVYNCECDYNGQLYNDGELVDVPDQPCQVCYCKGGEVMCNSLKCYLREDCEPLHVPGQCCPKYENCPIRDSASKAEVKNQTRSYNRSSNGTPNNDMQPWLLTKFVMHTSSPPLPKPTGETTTGDSIIVVSDWLTERRTTTEDVAEKEETQEFVYTDWPTIVTDVGYHTILHQTTQGQGERNPERTLSSLLPLDEVVFTRIDMPKDVHVDSHESSSSISPIGDPEGIVATGELEGSPRTTSTDVYEKVTLTSSYSKSDKLTENKIDQDDEIEKITNLPSSPVMTDIIFHAPVEEPIDSDHPKYSDKINAGIKEQLNKEVLNPETSTHTDTLLVVPQNIGNKSTDPKPMRNLSINKQVKPEDTLKTKEASKNISLKLDIESHGNITSHSKDVEITETEPLQHLLEMANPNEEGVKGIGSTVTMETETDNGMSSRPEKIRSNPQSIITVNYETTGILKNNTVEGTFHGNSTVEETTKLQLQTLNDEEKTDTLSDSNVIYQTSDSDVPYATVNSLDNIDVTTPYFVEDYMHGLVPESGRFVEESDNTELDLRNSGDDMTTASMKTIVFLDKEVSEQHNLLSKHPHSSFITESDSTGTEVTTEYVDAHDPTTSIPSSVPEEESSNIASEDNQNKYNVQSVVSGIKTLLYPSSTVANKNPNFNESMETDSQRLENDNIGDDTVNKVFVQNSDTSFGNNEEQEDISLAFDNDEFPNEDRDSMSNTPPVLELNSHVPFLQLGGHGSSDSSSDVDDDQLTTISGIEDERVDGEALITTEDILKDESYEKGSDVGSTTLFPIHIKQELPDYKYKVHPVETKEDVNSNDDLDIDAHVPTSHIPLTPGDLKTLAEYLIKETIKPVISTNESMYTTNPWLKGNLTSEEKVASIMSAANISIGVMNETYSGKKTAMETSTKTNDVIRTIKYEKEPITKGNSIMGTGSIIADKTGYLHNKHNTNRGFHKRFGNVSPKVNDDMETHYVSTEMSVAHKAPVPSSNLKSDAQMKLVSERTSHSSLFDVNNSQNQHDITTQKSRIFVLESERLQEQVSYLNGVGDENENTITTMEITSTQESKHEFDSFGQGESDSSQYELDNSQQDNAIKSMNQETVTLKPKIELGSTKSSSITFPNNDHTTLKESQ